ncbi:MAG: hypothetical protein IT186_20805 [Acidobacteria bacterium]|nr:hypothetical protein [Acidobacteriota bacterium]
MALTPYQRSVCRLIAANRTKSGESYVAGGAALDEVIGAARISRDVDLFSEMSCCSGTRLAGPNARYRNTGFRVSMLS